MKIVGHRGARGLAPENTLASLQKAIDHNVDMVEFDLRVTKDKVPVLHHNRTLRDPDNRRHVIRWNSYAALKQHDKDLATLEEALAAIGGKVPLYIEVKPRVNTSPIIKILKKHIGKTIKPEEIRFASFSPYTLRAMHKAFPEVVFSMLERWSGVKATYRGRRLGTRHLIFDQRCLWGGFIRMMSKGGWKLGAYVVNDPAKARRWEKDGLRMVVTDYPDKFTQG